MGGAHGRSCCARCRTTTKCIDAAFDPTGRFVVTRSGEVGDGYSSDRTGNSARVWEVETGRPRFTVTHADALNGAVFSPDGRFLATTSDDHTAQLWDVTAGRLRFTLKHDGPVQGAAFGPDGKRLVTLSESTARVWTLESDQPVVTLTRDGSMESASFSPDGASLVIAGSYGVQSWDLESGKEQHTFAAVLARDVSFSPDGRYLLSVSEREARLWDFKTASEVFKEPITQRGLVFGGFSQDGSLVITASGHRDRNGYGNPLVDNAVRYWDARTGESRLVHDLRSGGEPMMVVFGPGRRLVALNSAERIGRGRNETLRQNATASLWDVDTADRRLQLSLKHDSAVSAASFSPDGRRVLAVSGTAARLWDTATGKPHVVLNHDKDVTAATFTPDGKAIVTASSDGTARVWDVETGRQRFAAKHAQAVEDARLVANGRLLATISGHKGRLWAVPSGTAEIGPALLEMPDDVDPIKMDDWGDNFSPDGKLAVVRVRRDRPGLGHRGGQDPVHAQTRRLGANGRVYRGRAVAGDRRRREGRSRVGHDDRAADLHARALVGAGRASVSPDGRTVLTVQDDGWRICGIPAQERNGSRSTTAAAHATRNSSRAGRWRSPGRAKPVRLRVESDGLGRRDRPARSSVGTAAAESIGFSENGKAMFTTESRPIDPVPAWLDAQAIVRVWDVDTGEERFADPSAVTKA